MCEVPPAEFSWDILLASGSRRDGSDEENLISSLIPVRLLGADITQKKREQEDSAGRSGSSTTSVKLSTNHQHQIDNNSTLI